MFTISCIDWCFEFHTEKLKLIRLSAQRLMNEKGIHLVCKMAEQRLPKQTPVQLEALTQFWIRTLPFGPDYGIPL